MFLDTGWDGSIWEVFPKCGDRVDLSAGGRGMAEGSGERRCLALAIAGKGRQKRKRMPTP